MANRVNGLIITLNDDVNEENALELIKAIQHMKGIADISPLVKEPDQQYIGERKAIARITNKLIQLIQQETAVNK